jgi:hypothetical protein
MSKPEVVLGNPVRTGIGSYGGTLKDLPAPSLGAAVVRESVRRSGPDPAQIETLVMGNVIQAGAKMNPARQAAIGGGLPVRYRRVRALPPTLKYQPGVIAASGDYVVVHGRFSGNGRPRAWIAADVCRIANGVLAEHWDVLQDEATKAESKSGLPMFGEQFAD